MKKIIILNILFITTVSLIFAQNNIEISHRSKNTILGACIDKSCENQAKDGNGTLGQIYSNSACGLNYVQVSQKVTTRYGSPPGSGLPVTLTINGLPPCNQIEQAYLWWTFAGTTNTATATFTNPIGNTQTLNATLAGSGGAKCWSEGGTRLFRADVTPLISGNGNYNVNLSTSVWGTDGITLFIIYRDLSATYTGNLYINDGLRVQQGGGQNQAINYPSACQAGTNGKAFSIVSDMQDNVGATHQATHNGVNLNFPSNFYNFDESNITINAGQATSNFGYNKGGDCWAWSVMGVYFQTNCVTCTPATGTPSVATISQTNICSGQTVTVSLNPVPTSMQWQSAPSATGPWTDIAGATNSSYTSAPLTNDACFRAYYPTICGTDTSNIVCVTVDGLSTAPTGATASPNFICGSQPVTLNVIGGTLANNATWEWYSSSCGGNHVGTGASITVTPTQTSTYFVRAEGLCNTTTCAQVTVTVANLPTPQFSATSPCYPNTTQFTDNSTANSNGGITSWNWDFGNGNTSNQQNPAFNFNNAGNYNVTLVVINSDGCSNSITQQVTVYEKPNANFNFTNQCDGTAIPFASTASVNGSASITNYLWDFGNTNSGSGINTSHLYTTPGSYNVTHIVSTNEGCFDTITQTITVFNNPVAGFTHQNVCLGNAMNFTNTSTVGSPDVISSYLWAFGDGSPTSTQTNPSHTYLTEGNYTVTLIATTSNACSDVANITVSVYDAPTAGFTFNNVCENIPASFTNTSNNPNIGNIATFSWNFGDGSPLNSIDFNPIHTYTTAGTYTVTLIVNSSNLGCSDTLQQTIDIYPSPVSQFTFTNQCFGVPISFIDQSINAVSYNWNFGDNTNSITQNPQHLYNTSGNFSVSLTVSSANGCTNTSIQTITVYPKPNANFSATEVCYGIANEFTNLSNVIAPDIITTYQWNFGDNNTSGTQDPQHTYLQAGLYNTTLIVTTNHNCSDTITLPVIVNPNPVVDFDVDIISGCTPHCTSFNNQSTIASGSIAAFEWNFDNGNQSFIQNPSHCFINESLSPKYFNITLKATSDKGCVSTLTKNNYITSYPLPIADFSSDPNPTDIFRPNILFTDLSIGANSWLWNFGDNTFNPDTIIQNPTHTYLDTGIFNVWLYVENIYGCKDSIAKPVNIRPDFALFIPNAFTPNGDIYNPTFAAKGYGIKEFKMYIFNRWGELIFVADDINKGWDGTFNGVECQQDVYVYRIEVLDLNLKKHQYIGSVSLIR